MKRDLERERNELLRIINEEADESIRRMLALIPQQPRVQQKIVIRHSAEGTGCLPEMRSSRRF